MHSEAHSAGKTEKKRKKEDINNSEVLTLLIESS